MGRLELTLAILKPHVLKDPFALKSIREIILTSKFKIVKSKRHKFTLEEAEKFYEEHKKKFFYNRLITFITSDKSDLYILAREDAIKEWRRLMGPTKVFKAQYEEPGSIRGLFGLSDTRNATHGSDSPESARREIGILFPEFDIDRWYETEAKFFNWDNLLSFCDGQFLHKMIIELKRLFF